MEEKWDDRYKAHLDVRDFTKNNSFNYEELFSPVARLWTTSTLIAIGNLNIYFNQIDVKTAF